MDFVPPFDQIGINPPGPWQNANPDLGIEGSIPNAVLFDIVQNEILNVQDEAGLTRSGADKTQLLQALRSGKLIAFADTGTADALVLTPRTAYTALAFGAEITVLKGSNPNATTTPILSVSGLTRQIVKEDGTALGVGDLPASCLFKGISDGNKFRVLGLRKSDAASLAPVHLGHDTSTNAAQIVLTSVTGTVPTNPDKHVFVVDVANACAGATTATIPGLNGGAAVNVLRNDGTALQSGDYAAAERLLLVSDGTALRLVRLTINEVLALVASSTTVTNAIYNLSPGGLRHVAASAGLQQQSDIGVVPNFSTVIATGSFTNASFAQCGGACALHNTTGTYSGGTVRFALIDETNGAIVTSPYVGGGAAAANTQLPFTIPSYVFNGLTRAHTYHIAIYAQRSSSDGAQSTWDPSIYVQHDGN